MALTPQEALIYVMVVSAAADRTLSDGEIERIDALAARLPVFAGFDRMQLPAIAKDALDLTQRANDLDDVLDFIFADFPERLFDTAYALAVEVVAVDLEVRQEELRWLEMLSDHLELDKLVIAAIERAARARLKRP
ncbi:MAG: tellurite resistance TerB family protein [Alphaproteobacteria bacterium]|nr:tellurite resistance TerB family protein [Alphaproteobacteria bacterium]